MVGAEGLGRAADALSALDYAHDAAARPGLPARLVLHAGARRQVDLHPVVLDRHGNGWQPLGDDVFGAYPADGLAAMGSIGAAGSGASRLICNRATTSAIPPTRRIDMTSGCSPANSAFRCRPDGEPDRSPVIAPRLTPEPVA